MSEHTNLFITFLLGLICGIVLSGAISIIQQTFKISCNETEIEDGSYKKL